MWEEEEVQKNSEWWDDLDDEIYSVPSLERLRDIPIFSPERAFTGWCGADQVMSPWPLDFFAAGGLVVRPKRVLKTFFLAVLSKVSIRKLIIADPDSSLSRAVTDRTSWRAAARRIRIIQYFTEKESNAQVRPLQQRNDGVVICDEQNINEVDSSEQQIFGDLCAEFIGHKVSRAKKSCKKKNTIETPKRKPKRTLEDIWQHVGQKRADAAKALGVSVPTFKRYCRNYGIKRWKGDGCPRVAPDLLNNSVHQSSPGSIPAEVRGEKETSALLRAKQDDVIIKAKYGERISKFQLSSESGVGELNEAVAKRSLLELGSFYVE